MPLPPVNLANVNISLAQFQSISSGKYNAGEVKKNLVGTIRPIDVPVAKGDSWKFEPLLDEKGKPVVRAITWT